MSTPTNWPYWPVVYGYAEPEGNSPPGAGHAFRCKIFKKPRPCHLCHQPIFNQGSCCRVCKYVCHKVCESKEAADRFSDTSWQIHKQYYTQKLLPGAVEKPHKLPEKQKTYETRTKSNGERPTSTDNHIIYATLQDIRPSSANGKVTTKKVVEIQTVHTTLERKKPKVVTNGDIQLHTHEESFRNGSRVNKMLTSSSSHNGIYGEALTSQPRPSRNGGCSTASGGGMDLSFVTERIIALWFPASCSPQAYRQGQKQAAHMLTNKHGDNYMVFNLSEPRRTLRNEHKHVQEVGWSPRLAPPLERICSVCKQIESWLSDDHHRIAVLHARGSKDQLGVVVAAYMHYSNICGSAEQALDRFSMRRFLEDNIGPLYLPSNKRYVEYFAGLLSHNIKVNAAPLYLTHVTVLGAPSFQAGGCRAFLKLYAGQTPIYTSGVYSVSSGVGQFTVNVSGEPPGLQLRGDILIKCYHRGERGREIIFVCQFHTCAVTDYTLSFTRQELDHACNDGRFPADGAVELHFSAGPERRHPGPAPTPAVPVNMSDDDPVIRADSPFDVEDYDIDDDSDSDDVNHTFGPLDGSIYATIAKKPELSPGAVSSPLTVSMDSGISSAGHQQNANTNASSSPPLTSQPSPLSPEEQHRELDELLSDMMLTVQSIPDLKPLPAPTASTTTTTSRHDLDRDVHRYIDDEVDAVSNANDPNIPYHARQDSRPFTYGTMIGDAKKLSSPSLVRKASFNKSHGDTLNKVQTQVFPDYSPTNYNNNNKYSYNHNTTYRNRDPIDDLFTASALSANRRDEYQTRSTSSSWKSDTLKRSLTDSKLRRSPDKIETRREPFSDPESLSPPGAFRTNTSQNYHESYSTQNMTWLQKQQQKLKERKEMQLKEERQPYESSLISELRSVQNRHMRPTASHRLDGYTSDTTAFADDDEDFAIPLHINTRHPISPGSTTSYSTTRSIQSNGRTERPFVSVKRAHEQYSKNSTSLEEALAANPLGHVIRSPSRGASDDSGLLVERDKLHYSATTNITSNNSVGSKRDSGNANGDALTDLIANLSHGSDKSNTSSSNSSSAWQYREDNYATWRSNEADSSSPHSASSRPQTPAFPVSRTPYANSSTPTVQFDLPNERLPPKSPTTLRRMSFPSSSSSSTLKHTKLPEAARGRKDLSLSPSEFSNSNEIMHTTARNNSDSYQYSPKGSSFNGSSSPTVYQGNSRRSSVNSNNESPQEVSPVHVKFVSDTSRFWYKPNISREDTISMLRNKSPGTFVVRNSNTFPGAFGMALKVSTVPANVQNKDELVRHFLIEPTSRGVRLKGCQNEPVFSSLSALVYQHSITQIALPCRLLLPEQDIAPTDNSGNQTQLLLTQGAACNVLYLTTFDMESLTGPQAIKKGVTEMYKMKALPPVCVVHFKVNRQGITLTDNKRKIFFRKHYPINTVTHCGADPDDRTWTSSSGNDRIFGFVARKPASNVDNQCHLFAELDPDQPATAIVNFVNKVLASSSIKPNIV